MWDKFRETEEVNSTGLGECLHLGLLGSIEILYGLKIEHDFQFLFQISLDNIISGAISLQNCEDSKFRKY